jgi:hypothetical protein
MILNFIILIPQDIPSFVINNYSTPNLKSIGHVDRNRKYLIIEILSELKFPTVISKCPYSSKSLVMTDQNPLPES